MNSSKHIKILCAALLIAAMTVVGCSNESTSQEPTPMQKLSNTVSAAVAESLVQAVKAKADTSAASGALSSSVANDGPSRAQVTLAKNKFGDQVTDMIVIGTSVFALTPDGVAVFDFVSGTQRVIPSERRLNAIVSHAGKLYAGGDGLFVVEDSVLQPVAIELPGAITALEGFTYRLLIGTEQGLYSRSIFGDEVLLRDLSIAAMVTAGDQVWIGTDGSGLYQFDGVDFRQRYLSRDRELFDHVTALDYKYDHLYVGTIDGLYVYDGGRWESYDVIDGLPSVHITAIDASDWVVLIGTENGVASLFKRELIPIGKLESVEVSSLARYGNKILVGTVGGDVLVKSGPVVRPLIRRSGESTINVFSALK